MPAIIDTTVWIDFFRNAKTQQTDLLEVVVRRGEAALGDWIATFCIERGLPLLRNDRDFDPFEEHLKLKVLHRFP